ncbi:MAG: hypothetical protein R3309_17445, partial [Reinekea sp.]|nr:hypothetical protein [Reinekea sp.]
MKIRKLTSKIHPYSKRIPSVNRHSFEVESIDEFARYYSLNDIELEDKGPYESYRYVEDLNLRRYWDVQTVSNIVRNSNGDDIIEIGTAEGHMTDMLARLAPNSTVHTLNIPPEDLLEGKGGNKTTRAFSTEEIGAVYKKNRRQNVRQIYCDSRLWKPDVNNIGVAFIDGCHDADYVYNDTKKV